MLILKFIYLKTGKRLPIGLLLKAAIYKPLDHWIILRNVEILDAINILLNELTR